MSECLVRFRNLVISLITEGMHAAISINLVQASYVNPAAGSAYLKPAMLWVLLAGTDSAIPMQSLA